MESASLIYFLLAFICFLASLDLWRQYSIKNYNYMFEQWQKAVKHSDEFWKIGFRIEDLEYKLEMQYNRSLALKKTADHLPYMLNLDSTLRYRKTVENVPYIRHSRIAIHGMGHNDSSVYTITCDSPNGNPIRVGYNDFRTDARDMCQVSTSTSSVGFGPLAMFERVDAGEGTFALRSIATGRFLRAVGPPPASKSQDYLYYQPPTQYKLLVGGKSMGVSEVFRITQEGYIYSAVVDGAFACSSGQMVTGYPSSSSYLQGNVLSFNKVSSADLQSAYMLVDLSEKLLKIQNRHTESNKKSPAETKKQVHGVMSKDSDNPVRICIGVPMTSKGTDMLEISDSPFWTNLFDSFMKSIDWRSNRYIFRFYIGFDKADELYDTGDAWQLFREEFISRATYRMVEQLMDESATAAVLQTHLTLKLMHFAHLEGAPSQVVSQLMLAGYGDNFDYFYQVNDDTMIVSPNWAPRLVQNLAANQLVPNFGVTGPTDSNNEKIFTHSFVHRTHFDIFGHLFPTSFKNWWSDDWISTVYGQEHTFLVPDVSIMHNVQAQKTQGTTRYEVDQGAQIRLEAELRIGHSQIDRWLKDNKLPRLPLPNICGYVPLVQVLARELLDTDQFKRLEAQGFGTISS